MPDDPGGIDNRAAWKVLEPSTKPWLCCLQRQATRSPAAATAVPAAKVPGAQGQPHTTIVGGGHFLQEDRAPSSHEVIADVHRARPRQRSD
jgi:haloalkane dehalogenase